jgi:peptidoglycan/xylan/chitin deacetylase (PgdA/CDA1 family)
MPPVKTWRLPVLAPRTAASTIPLLLITLVPPAPVNSWAGGLEPIPDRLVVLTFDDSVKSHVTVARPVLKRYGFGATFFVTEGFHFTADKTNYMTWAEIRALHDDGFEIGNHTRDHMGVSEANVGRLQEQLRGIDRRCEEAGIPKPVSFAWPGNALAPEALTVLRDHGILFARRGGAPEYPYERGRGFAYEPGEDHPLLIPSAGDARPAWTLDDFKAAVAQARGGRVAVLQFHGVPEGEHPWVNTPRERFEQYMEYLHDGGYKVIALGDLARYVDPGRRPDDPWAVIRRRKDQITPGRRAGRATPRAPVSRRSPGIPGGTHDRRSTDTR